MISISRQQASVASPQLEIRDLRVVIAIGSAGTTAAAAERLHLTQSAVSRALQVAEAHAGTALFTRTARGLVPTEAGAAVLAAAPALLVELAALERRLREPAPQPRRVRLVAECYMAYPWLTEVVLSLRRSAPDLRIEMPIEHSQRAGEALAAGELDAAMLTSPAPQGALAQELFEDELVFLVSASHPLARKAALKPRDVAESTLLVPNARSGDGWFLRQVFGARPPRVRAERLPVTEAIVELARAGVGVAVLSEWVAAPYLRAPESGLKMLRLAKGPLVRRWRFAYRPELAPAAPLLVDAILGARPIARLEPPAASAAPRRRAETRQKQGRLSARER